MKPWSFLLQFLTKVFTKVFTKVVVYRLSTKVPGSNGDETKSPIKCPISCPQKLWPEIQISRHGGIDLIVICFRGQLGPVKISKKKIFEI